MIQPFRILIEGFDGSDVVPFSLCFGRRRLGLSDGLRTSFQGCSIRRFPDWMIKRHGDSPVGHGAGGISFGYTRKFLVGFLIPKGMEHRDGTVELRLD